MKTLNDVLLYLNRIPGINSGGCGVAALAIYRWLMAQGEKDLTIDFFYVSSDKHDKEANSQLIQKGELELIAPSHVAVGRGHTLIDSHGIDEIAERYNFGHSVNEEIMVATLNNRDSWNTYFDRKHTKRIAKTLKINLSDIDI